jgi:cell filamentation protein
LRIHTPCLFTEESDVVEALAVVHTELVLIHPFREGNGRIARMLATVMAVQAGYPPLDFGGIRGKKKQAYFAAIQAGVDRNYEPMKSIFSEVIGRTVSKPWKF